MNIILKSYITNAKLTALPLPLLFPQFQASGIRRGAILGHSPDLSSSPTWQGGAGGGSIYLVRLTW